jgi:hypothetical protein
MPTRKQRRREAKQKRHEYEFVYVDAEGNELDEPLEELEQETSSRDERRNGKPAAARSDKAKGRQQRGGRATRTPPPPSWERAAKRALMLGIVVFFLFGVMNTKASNRWVAAAVPAVLYTALFIPFTYAIDRFAYNRWLRRQQGADKSGSRPAKKR